MNANTDKKGGPVEILTRCRTKASGVEGAVSEASLMRVRCEMAVFGTRERQDGGMPVIRRIHRFNRRHSAAQNIDNSNHT